MLNRAHLIQLFLVCILALAGCHTSQSSRTPAVLSDNTAASAQVLATDDFDQYGGWTGISAEATGFFRIEQIDGRWWLITPEGHAFFSTGICHIGSYGYYAPDLGYSPYEEYVLDLYGSREAWAEVTAERLRAWNFNTIGSWSENHLFPEFPHTRILNISGADWEHGIVPDYFGTDFLDRAESQAASICTTLRDDPYLVGYFLDNELRWGYDWRSLHELFDDYLLFPAETPGKQALVCLLESRYRGDIAEFNRIWNEAFSNFDEILDACFLGPPADGVRAWLDKKALLRQIAEQYFSVGRTAVLAHDPNHLVLGCRFVSWTTPVEVAEVAASYVDVLTVNHYRAWPWLELLGNLMPGMVHPFDMLQRFYRITNRPILISEFSVRGADAVPPNTHPPPIVFPVMATQADRADWFENYATECFDTGYIVGYHWYAYMDEPVTGRFDGEDSNFGLVDEQDNPYGPLVERMTQVNRRPYEWPGS